LAIVNNGPMNMGKLLLNEKLFSSCESSMEIIIFCNWDIGISPYHESHHGAEIYCL
jgi:hypothetical protein